MSHKAVLVLTCQSEPEMSLLIDTVPEARSDGKLADVTQADEMRPPFSVKTGGLITSTASEGTRHTVQTPGNLRRTLSRRP